GRQWKHLRLLLQAADSSSLPPDRPNYLNIQSPPSIFPPKRYCDVTGFEVIARRRLVTRDELGFGDEMVLMKMKMLMVMSPLR
ncbi:hypothetical protein ZWY2020_016873, partial [Hordeum vulgare]